MNIRNVGANRYRYHVVAWHIYVFTVSRSVTAECGSNKKVLTNKRNK